MDKYLNKFYDIIDKIGKHNFILIIFIFIVFITTSLYQTFSLYTESEGFSAISGIDTYSFILNNSNTTNSVTIPANSSKNVDITIKNQYQASLKYSIYSSEKSNNDTNFIFGYSTASEHPANGIIPANTNYVITIKVYNYTNDNKTIDFGVLYGFENGGELTLDSGQYLIEPLYLMRNLFSKWDSDYNYYRADNYREKIVKASFVDLDTIDSNSNVSLENALAEWDLSVGEIDKNYNRVMAWVVPSVSSTSGYDLYIGAEGKIYVESLYAMFSQMSALQSVDFSNLDTSLVKDMAFFFRECANLTTLDVSSWDTSNVTNMWSLFGGCRSLGSLDLSNFDTSSVIKMRTMFYQCSSLTSLNLSNFDTSNVTDMVQMFAEDSNLTLITLSNFDTRNVTDMEIMFQGCRSLNSLDVSNFNTSKVTNMSLMFSQCSSLTSLDLSNFDTSKVTYMNYMFNECTELTNLDLSNFNTSKVTEVGAMFEWCTKLTSLDLSNFNTSNVTNMREMFYECRSLVSLDLSNFNTSKVTYMDNMFSGCSSLTSLDLSNFDTSKVTDFTRMFRGCKKLQYTQYNSSTDFEIFSILIKSNIKVTPTYGNMFEEAAIEGNAEIRVYFEANTLDLVRSMVNTKSTNSNVIMYPPFLSEMEVGKYVKFVGNNGCSNTNTVNGYTSCSGKNANYVSDTNMGYCNSSSNKFNVNGWRIGYIENGSAYLISAGATDCMCTNSEGNAQNSSCSAGTTDLSQHLNNMNNIALQYCNTEYAKGGVCNNTTSWAMNTTDFQKITGKALSSTSCYNVYNDTSCGYNNTLIDNRGFYSYASPYKEGQKYVFYYYPVDRFISYYTSSGLYGVRPVLALDSSVVVIGGDGSYESPYELDIIK